jgi:hypothetical protein
MPSTITTSTQNVGGMGGEFQRKHGPKFGILRRLAKCNVDFSVLTEVQCDQGNIKKVKLYEQMRPMLYSFFSWANGGAIVFSNPAYELINHSV